VLLVQGLHAYYDKSRVLHGVSLAVREGEAVALLGRNGAGKSTTLKSIMNLVKKREGEIRYRGTDLKPLEPFEIARLGVAYVPENRGIFTKLSVEQNLQIAVHRHSSWTLDDVYRLFPRLHERRMSWGFTLSGGEQQMLAIARGLVGGPSLMLLDEPSQGLAPVVLNEVVRVIAEVKAAGIAVLLVEQNLELCMRLAERFYILDSGRTVYEGAKEEFAGAEHVRQQYLTLEGVVAARPAAS
jgi:branched-chain amino acid transport system ATP-binding protein